MNTMFQPLVSFDGVAVSTFKRQVTHKQWNQPHDRTDASLFLCSGPDAGSTNNSMAAQISRYHKSDIDFNHQKENLVIRKHLVYREFNMKNSSELKKDIVFRDTCLPHSYEVKGDLSAFSKKGTTNYRVDPKLLNNVLEVYLIKYGLLKEKCLKETAFPGIFSLDDFKNQIHLNKIKEANPHEVFSLATESKESSLSLQAYISECNPEDLEHVIDKVKYFIELLMNHCFGNFVAQRLVVKSQAIFEHVECIALENFEEFMTNEFSSRVLQLIIEKSAIFCKFALNYFRRNIKKSLSCNSSCHLILACIRNAKDVSSIEFVHDYLRKTPRYMGNKYYQRILITYLQTASLSQVNGFAYTLGAHNSVCQILNKKACSNMLLVLIQRGDPTTIDSVNKLLKNDVSRLLETKYFLFVIQKLSQGQESEFLSNAFNILTNLATKKLQHLSQKESTMHTFLYVVMLCCNRELESNLDCFLNRPEVMIQTSQVIKSCFNKKSSDSITTILGVSKNRDTL